MKGSPGAFHLFTQHPVKLLILDLAGAKSKKPNETWGYRFGSRQIGCRTWLAPNPGGGCHGFSRNPVTDLGPDLAGAKSKIINDF